MPASYIKGNADDTAGVGYCVNAPKHRSAMEGVRIMAVKLVQDYELW